MGAERAPQGLNWACPGGFGRNRSGEGQAAGRVAARPARAGMWGVGGRGAVRCHRARLRSARERGKRA